MYLMTEKRVMISERIQSGLTKFFETLPEAEKEAQLKRSYVYPVYSKDMELKGWAVPK